MEQTGAEWSVLKSLLPSGWEEAARTTGAFQRVRYTKAPGELLRLLLYHAVSGGSLRTTVTQSRAAGIAAMSPVALHKRLRTSGDWLAWMAAALCAEFREAPRLPHELRLRAIDSTALSHPGSQGTNWRLHYMLDLRSLSCDWHELTDVSGGEAMARAPVQAGDVVLGDRNFSNRKDIEYLANAGAYALVRLRWGHCAMLDAEGRPFDALRAAAPIEAGQVGSWSVSLPQATGDPAVRGRVIMVRLPVPLAEKAMRRARRHAERKGKSIDDRTLQAAQYVMLFTTLPPEILSDEMVLELYRFRWQIELAFKRHKQLLQLGRLPHKDPEAARAWILSKLLVALLLEKLYRNAKSFFPWGYRIESTRRQSA